ncbi:MAG: hypothetical protein CL878_00690 [Dehalococcoidia bacterium]|nr:hypothetical protein [Dehalococcoidia bacterium]
MARTNANRLLVEQPGAVQLTVRLQPRANQTEVRGVRAGELVVAVSAPPAEGAANAALVKHLAQRLHIARSRIKIVRGSKSRSKVLCISGLDGARVEASLRLSREG